MNEYASYTIAKARQAELLREADGARLAKLARSTIAHRAERGWTHAPLGRRLVAGLATLLR